MLYKKPSRIMIYPRDIQNITGKKARSAYRLHNQIKTHFGKVKKDLLTVMELCEYWKLDPEVVKKFLDD